MTVDLLYRHPSESEVLHPTDPQCGTVGFQTFRTQTFLVPRSFAPTTQKSLTLGLTLTLTFALTRNSNTNT